MRFSWISLIKTIYKSEIPSKIALFAIAWPGELIFILVWVIFAQNAAVGLFFLTIILFGYPLEIHFIRMGELLLIKEKTIVTELKKMECNKTIP